MAQDAELAKELPLAGVILCCTSILAEHRSQLADIACQMGAIHKFDLTSDVTHLIVGDINTPKYKYVAKERNDVKVLRAEWVEAVRSSWILGGDTDIRTLEVEYQLPPFFGLSICITGFEDMDFRNHLQKTVSSNGGEFRKDLTKTVTHLVARVGDGKKYKFAVLWGIKVVSLKWLEDSIQRTMALDEALYDPLMPVEQQGIGAWNRSKPAITEKITKPQETGHQRARKLRRVASIKLGGQTEGIWSALVPNPSTVVDNNDGSQYDGSQQLVGNARPNLLDTKSFASETTFPERHDSVSHDIKPSPVLPIVEQQPRGFWDNCRFYMTGFTKEQARILESHLFAQDALISPSLDDLLQHDNQLFMVVPFNLPRREIPGIDEDMDELKIVTDMWIERCLRSHAFVAPEAHITSTPFPKFPIPAFQGMRICSTGFTGIDLLHLCKLVNLLGATYDEYLTANASVLICNTTSPSPEKLRHVFEWNIPPVIADWLWISVQTGEKKPYAPYLIPDKRTVSQGGHKPSESHLAGHRLENPLPLDHYSSDHSNTHQTSEEMDGGQFNPPETEATNDRPSTALREVSANLPVKPSRSPSPSKESIPPNPPISPIPLPQRDSTSKPTNNLENSISLNTAISELLKQKRTRTQHSTAETEVPVRSQRRRKLFGRASSSCSTLTTDLQRGISRASSIDTLNEDGYGSVVDGLDSPSTKTPSNAPSFISMPAQRRDVSRPEQIEAQQMLQRRLALFQSNSANGEFAEKGAGEDEPLPLTQLGYEDPDAVAMREMISNQSQKDNTAEGNGPPGSRAGKKLIIGKIQDGWGGGRRTRSRKSGG
ncbi:BRCT domain-containing protein [Arthroderma uncinatum]|uniref:BRCT domain-containing protein n=1 Tax=Arthroderma uncinatum TaxID=74035 RepID=UPI00144A6258|nr:BRCT domain-containing protein [Arthroderma uncinatum]KAF3483384.1 BRCT domain-containing protein [Arthroderma uncinatum]